MSEMPVGSCKLEALVSEIRACRICRDAPLGKPLAHEPRPVLRPSSTARLLIVAQAPGTRVHESGLPFTDKSGDRLRAWTGLDGATFYDVSRVAIVGMGFCFPGLDPSGGDLPPRPECRLTWHDRLLPLMPQIELVLAIGRYAQSYLLGREAVGRSVGAIVGDYAGLLDRSGTPRMFPLPHPSWRNTAWLRRNPWFGAELLPVLRAEVTSAIRPR